MVEKHEMIVICNGLANNQEIVGKRVDKLKHEVMDTLKKARTVYFKTESSK